ncbi:MAG: M14 family metallopeptidase [Acidobacteriaceae bacterium]
MTRNIASFLLCAGLFFSSISLALSQPQNTNWQTPAEASNYQTTPDYAATMAYLRRIAAAAPTEVKIEPYGTSGEGRELNIVIASKDGDFDPARIHAAHRPIVLVQNTIHAGEMDGKDACLALLRDMVITRSQAALLDNAVFIFIPIYNADGFARLSPYNRINQNGPEDMGWRGNGTNLNLNRDYLKADAPATRAFLKMFHHWLPDFYVDDHVTDGADFQYDVTFSIDDGPNVYGPTAKWIDNVVKPTLVKDVDAVPGHLAFPHYITLIDDTDPAKGLDYFAFPPRFSNGYAILENRPGMLVEMHMLKDYKTRIAGNYALLRALMEIVNQNAAKLIQLNAADDAQATRLTGKPFPLAVAWGGQTTPVLFHGYQYTRQLSAVSGAMWIQYSHVPWNATIPDRTGSKVSISITPPAAYIVPRQWTHVINVLAAHQVKIRRTTAAWTGKIQTWHCGGMQWNRAPYEGRHPIFSGESEHQPGKFGHCDLVDQTLTFPAGSAVIPLNQRLSKVAIEWLEPQAPDSAMAWGFFDPIFEQKEYGEDYVVEKLARQMMDQDTKLKQEFEQKIETDPKFAASPSARLNFFYDRSPWGKANRVGDYPVGRLSSLNGIPLTK